MLLPIIPAILLVAVLAGVSSIQTAHAAGPVGLVCLNDAAGAAAPPANPCNATPITFDGPNPSAPQISPTQIRVGVYINGSDAINGFDISLLVNHLFLTPAGFDLTGSVLPTPVTVILECRQNVLIQGSVCAPTDSIDTYHLVITGALGALTTPPTSGLLFTAIYNVVGTTPAAGINVGFQIGCSSSTSVPGGVCVTISNGSVNAVPETIQSGTLFANSVNPPFVAITSNAVNGNVTAIKGGVSPTVTITATAEGGFPAGTGCGGFGCAVDSVAFSADVSSGFTAPTFSVASCATGGLSCTTVATINTGTAGTYTITVYGTYVSDSGTIGITLRGPVKITVNIQDVGFTVNGAPFANAQTAFMAKQGGSPLFFVTAQSLGQYTGSISYTITLGSQGTTGLVLTSYIVPAAFTLPAGATITKAVNVTAATNEGLAQIKINQLTTPSVGAHASGILSIRVSGFTLSTNTTSLTINQGATHQVTVLSTSLGNPAATNGFAGAVTLSDTFTCTCTGTLATTFLQPSITLAAGGSSNANVTFSSTTAGTYTVTLRGTGGTNNDMTNSTTLTVVVQSSAGFTLTASPTTVTVLAGAAGTSTITVSSQGTFNQAVALTATVSPTTGLTCTLSPTSVTPPAGGTATSTLSCNGSATSPSYTVTVTGTSTGFTAQTTTVTYTVQDFTIAASPTSVTVVAGSAGTSSITVTAVNGFAGVVSIVTNATASCTVSPTSVTGSGSATLSCTFASGGTFHVGVTGTSSSLSHSVTVTYVVQDFTITATPASVTVNAGSAGTSSISVAAVNGFAGVVSLTTNSTSCSISPTSVTGSGSATLSCTFASASTVHVGVTGTSGSRSHSVTVTYIVQDFTIAASPTSVNVNVNAAGTSSIAITAQNGFTGVVSLATNTTASCTVSPTSVTGSGTSTLSCTFPAA